MWEGKGGESQAFIWAAVDPVDTWPLASLAKILFKILTGGWEWFDAKFIAFLVSNKKKLAPHESQRKSSFLLPWSSLMKTTVRAHEL